ncbi:MAG: acetyltransferase [Methanomicrobiaceae archaeon]|nr:acetyltransferase [Methanomicrobiaceae archaeon]
MDKNDGSNPEKTTKVVIFGTGDVAELALFYFTHDSPYEVVAFSADEQYITEKTAYGLPLVPFEKIEDFYPPDKYSMFVALSYKDVNKIRAQKYYEAKEKGYELVSYVCSRSVLWNDLDVGDNCFIFENQTIQPFVKIGNNVTMWSGNHIGHSSIIKDHSFLTSHVVVSGHVVIEPYCFLGVNATLRDGITIAEGSVIGAGATVIKNTVERGVYIGKAAELFQKDSSKSKYFTNTAYSERK